MKNHRTRGRVRPNSLLISQEGSDSAQGQWTESEDQALVASGFERQHDQEADLWSKDGVWYGRNAALQKLGQKPLASSSFREDLMPETRSALVRYPCIGTATGGIHRDTASANQQ
jgi:hypothetical protein